MKSNKSYTDHIFEFEKDGEVIATGKLTKNLPKREKDKEFSLEEYLDEREQYLLGKIKQWETKSSVCRCAQARLHEIKTLKKKIS